MTSSAPVSKPSSIPTLRKAFAFLNDWSRTTRWAVGLTLLDVLFTFGGGFILMALPRDVGSNSVVQLVVIVLAVALTPVALSFSIQSVRWYRQGSAFAVGLTALIVSAVLALYALVEILQGIALVGFLVLLGAALR